MKTNNEEKNVYVQPECKVFQVQKMSIFTGSAQTESLTEEEYDW